MMMGYNNDPHNMISRPKLNPIVPRPPPVPSASTHPEQQMVVVSSRWNPTPEQLQTLEELYRRGTRTPSADEIQHITAHLRRFGRIEGKNVFYWFQNHKARERQKRRRQLHLHSPTPAHQPPFLIHQSIQEVEETRNWAIPTLSQKSVLEERTRKEELLAVEEEEEDENDRRRKSFPVTWNHKQSLANHINSTCSPAFKTLELFPVNTSREQVENATPHFIEFLPLKN